MSSAPVTQEFGFAKTTRLAKQLALACHPGPTIGVTAFAVVLAILADCSTPTVLILGTAVFCGQLTIGWSNDRIDAGRDARAGRRDKPLATGSLPTRTVETAIAAALVATVALSLLLGFRAGLLHLAAVTCGWIYNAGVKSTLWSWLPYAIAFGALPGVATLAANPHRLPPLWLIGAGAALGTVAHLTNVVPDLADDERTGVRGLPHLLGAHRSLLISSVMLVGTTLLVVLGPVGLISAWRYAGLGTAILLSTVGCWWALRHPSAHATFYGLFLIVALELALMASTADRLR